MKNLSPWKNIKVLNIKILEILFGGYFWKIFRHVLGPIYLTKSHQSHFSQMTVQILKLVHFCIFFIHLQLLVQFHVIIISGFNSITRFEYIFIYIRDFEANGSRLFVNPLSTALTLLRRLTNYIKLQRKYVYF